MLRRNRANETSKKWIIIFATTKESYDRESDDGSNSGFTEQMNSLSDAREFCDPESGSSSGVTHVHDQTPTIMSPRTMPRCDSGLPAWFTKLRTGITGNVFERPPAQEGQSSTIFPQFKKIGIFISRYGAWHQTQHGEIWKGNQWVRRFNHHTSNVEVEFWTIRVEFILTWVWWIIREFPLRNGILDKFLTLWNFKVGSLTSGLKFVCKQPNIKSLCCGVKKFEVAKSIDELVTSRSITGRHNFPDFDIVDAMIASALKKHINTQSDLPKKSKCRRATSSKFRPVLTRKTNCVHDLRVFPCNRSLWKQCKDSRTWSVWLCRMTMSKISM